MIDLINKYTNGQNVKYNLASGWFAFLITSNIIAVINCFGPVQLTKLLQKGVASLILIIPLYLAFLLGFKFKNIEEAATYKPKNLQMYRWFLLFYSLFSIALLNLSQRLLLKV